jgi:hypothetical protein
MERKFSIAINEIGGSYTLSCSSWVIVDGERTQDVPPLNRAGFESPEEAWEAYTQWKGE